MYTITILRSSAKSQTSFKDMLDPKRSKFGPKRAQNGQGYFFPDYKPQKKTIRIVSIKKSS